VKVDPTVFDHVKDGLGQDFAVCDHCRTVHAEFLDQFNEPFAARTVRDDGDTEFFGCLFDRAGHEFAASPLLRIGTRQDGHNFVV
jgi:hypothetical protein